METAIWIIAICNVVRVLADLHQVIMLHAEAKERLEAYKKIMDPEKDDKFNRACASAFKEAIIEECDKNKEAEYAEEMKNERRENNATV